MVVRHDSTKNHFEHRPLYEELAEEFCRRITIGRWPVGRPLKTEALIAAELGVSLGSVRRAFDRLERMNLIDRIPGRGTIVRELDCERRLACLTNIVDAQGLAVVGEIAIYDVSRTQADDTTALALGIKKGDALVQVERTRSHQGRVFLIETAYLPIGPEEALPSADTLWGSARNFVVAGEIVVKRQEFARAVDRKDVPSSARFAGLVEPLLSIHRTHLSFDDRPLEYCRAFCQLGSELRYRIC